METNHGCLARARVLVTSLLLAMFSGTTFSEEQEGLCRTRLILYITATTIREVLANRSSQRLDRGFATKGSDGFRENSLPRVSRLPRSGHGRELNMHGETVA